MAKKPPTKLHPLGRGKETFFWSFVVALMLFSLGGLFSIYEGFHKLENLAPLDHPVIGVAVLVIALGLEGMSLMACVKEVRRDAGFTTFRRWVRETTRADMLVLFLEDAAAMLGLAVALVMLTIAWATGDSLWDALGSIGVGLLLIGIALVLAREVKSLLIGEAPTLNYREAIITILAATIPGSRLLKIIAVQQGIEHVMMAYKIYIEDTVITARDAAVLVNGFEAAVKKRFPEIKWQFSEIDVVD